MIWKIYNYLLRNTSLSQRQWFFKTEPRAFAVLDTPGQACPACATPASHRSDYPSRRAPFYDYDVLWCANCGLGFVPGIGSKLDAYYTTDYAEENRRDRDLAPDTYFAQFEEGEDPTLVTYARRARRQFKLLRRHKARFTRTLDYGSGPGYFLNECDAKIRHAVEPDLMSHKYLAHLGAEIHHDHTTLPQGFFDCILASHAIEHLPPEALQEVLKALLAALAPGGRMLIEVPQGGHSHLHLAGHRQEPHTLFFTGEALERALKTAGAPILKTIAMGKTESPRRDNPIYRPGDADFHCTSRGSLSVICTTDRKRPKSGKGTPQAAQDPQR